MSVFVYDMESIQRIPCNLITFQKNNGMADSQ